MYAVVRTGGKQEKVSVGDVIRVEKIDAPVGDAVGLDSVCLLVKDDAIIVDPAVLGEAKVLCYVVDQGKGKKIRVFKKKRKNNYTRTRGHRQLYTELKVNEIVG